MLTINPNKYFNIEETNNFFYLLYFLIFKDFNFFFFKLSLDKIGYSQRRYFTFMNWIDKIKIMQGNEFDHIILGKI